MRLLQKLQWCAVENVLSAVGVGATNDCTAFGSSQVKGVPEKSKR
jgi:hypothetical protein